MDDVGLANIKLTRGYRPRAIADVVAAHMAYYEPAWKFGLQFEAKVATELAAFMQRYDPDRDLFLSAALSDGRLLGSITIDGVEGKGSEGAHLRWFIATDDARGAGLGRRLMTEAVAFSDAQGYDRIYLTTFAGLDAARHLYEKFGFELVAEIANDDWQGSVGEQRFERRRPASGH